MLWYNDAPPLAAHTYSYSVRSTTGSGTSDNNPIGKGATSIGGFTVVRDGGYANATWDASKVSGLLGYNVYRNAVRIATNHPTLEYSDATNAASNAHGYHVCWNATEGEGPCIAPIGSIQLLSPAAGSSRPANQGNTYRTTATALVDEAGFNSLNRVEFRSGSATGAVLATAESAPWQGEINLGIGTTTLCAVAVDNLGSRASTCNTFQVHASAPGAPSSLLAQPGSSPGQVRITWSAASHATGYPVAGYRVYRGTIAGGPYAAIGSTTALTFTDAGLATGSFVYVVRAVNALNNEGPASNEATALTSGAPNTLTDGFTSASYQSESPTGNTPFGGLTLKPTLPGTGSPRPSVDLANGEFVASFPLLQAEEPVGEENFVFALTYRSIGNPTGNKSVSWRWDANWLQHLEASGTDYVFFTGDGRTLRFTPAVSGGWEGPAGSYQKIESVGSNLELKDRGGNRRVFDASKSLKLTDVYDAANNHWILAYAITDGRLQSLTDPLGRTVTFTYDPKVSVTGNPFWATHHQPLLTAITDWTGRSALLQYNLGTGQLVAIKTPGTTAEAPIVTRLEYDANNRLTAIRDPLDAYYARVDYDASGRVVAQRAAAGSDGYFQYHYGSGVTFAWNGNGNKVEWQFLSSEVTTPRVVPSAKIEHTKGLRATDPSSYSTKYTHNGQDELTRITYPAGNFVFYTYDESATSFFARGNLLTQARSPGPVPASTLQSTSQESITTQYTYDPACNKPTAIVDARGTDTSFVPPNGGTTSTTRYTTTITYNAACKPLTIQGPNVNPAGIPHPSFTAAYNNQVITDTYTYNTAGQLLTHTDPAGVVTTRTYYTTPSTPGKPAGHLESVTVDPGASLHLALTTTHEYTDTGVVNKTVDPKGDVRTYTVDRRGRTTQETGPVLTLPAPASAASILTRWTYDANENLVRLERETDPGSGSFVSTEYTYDGLGRRLSETVHPSATHAITLRYAYDGNGNLVRGTGGAGEVQTWTYDERDLLLSQSGPEGGTYAYDANGNLRQHTNPLGQVTSHQYDGYDRLAVTTDAHQSRFVTSYDPASNVVTEKGLGGTSGKVLYELTFVHDEANQVYRRQAWMQAADTMPPATATTLGTGGQWVTTLQEYDARGHLAREINDNGHVTTFNYDAAGRLSTTTDALGNTVEHTHDKNGNLLQTKETIQGATTTTCPQVCTTTHAYDAEDRLTTTTNPDGTTRFNTYDGRGNLVKIVDEAGNTVHFEYDLANRPSATRRVNTTSPVTYVTTRTSWDDENRVQSRCDDTGLCTTYTYVPATPLVATQTPPAGMGPAVTNTYDAGGNLRRVASASGKVVNLTYDALDRLTTVALVGGASQFSGTTRQQFVYDDMGRITQATDNGIGNLSGGVVTKLGQITVAQQWDTLGRVIVETQLGQPITHARDGVGNILSTVYPSSDGRAVSRTYDANERLDRVWDTKGLLVDYTYQGSLVSQKAFGGLTPSPPATGIVSAVARTVVTYDGMERPAIIDHRDGTGTLLAGLTTRFDAAGNRVAQKLQGNVAGASVDKYSQLYTLDSLYQTTAWKRGSLTNSSPSTPYDTVASPLSEASWPSMDGKRNWLAWTVDATACTRFTTVTSGSPSVRQVTDTCASLPATPYAYDAEGNLRSDGAYTYHWDFLNRLIRVHNTTSGALVVGYGYDAFDRRVVKVFPDNVVSAPGVQAPEEAWYNFVGHHVIQESQPIGSVLPTGVPSTPPEIHVIRQWVYGPVVDEVLVMDVDANQDGTSAISPGDKRYFFFYDSASNVLGLANEAGRLIEGYAYHPYGAVTILKPATGAPNVKWDGTDTVSTGTYGTDPKPRPYSPSGNLWYFTGRQYDPEIGSYNYRARQYHPTLGQFMSVDPTGTWGDPVNLGNPYAYVGNNPGTWRDPTGRVSWGAVGWSAERFGTAVAAFVPCGCTEWAREEVRENYARFEARADVPELLRFGAVVLGPPQTQEDAVVALALASVLPLAVGGKAGAAGLRTASRTKVVAEVVEDATKVAVDLSRSAPGRTALGRTGSGLSDEILPAPQVSSKKLQNIINDLYKGTTNPSKIGTGTTADAVRYELATGNAVGGRFHSEKADIYSRALGKWLQANPKAPYHDQLIARSLLDDLDLARRGMG